MYNSVHSTHALLKGKECSRRLSECEEPDCHGNGKCIKGECHCSAGFKGESCQQGIALNIVYKYIYNCKLIIDHILV